MSCIEASQLFLSSAKTNLDAYANYTVYLCAQTLGVLFGCASRTPHPCASCQSVPEEDGNSYVHRWRELFGHVEQWYENRPSQMKPIFTVTAPGHSGRDRPFPTVLYGNGDASMPFLLSGYTAQLIPTSLWQPTVPRQRPVVAPAEAQDIAYG